MSPLQVWLLRVKEYDVPADHVFTEREARYLFSTFSVMAYSEENAVEELMKRTGFGIVEVEFI